MRVQCLSAETNFNWSRDHHAEEDYLCGDRLGFEVILSGIIGQEHIDTCQLAQDRTLFRRIILPVAMLYVVIGWRDVNFQMDTSVRLDWVKASSNIYGTRFNRDVMEKLPLGDKLNAVHAGFVIFFYSVKNVFAEIQVNRASRFQPSLSRTHPMELVMSSVILNYFLLEFVARMKLHHNVRSIAEVGLCDSRIIYRDFRYSAEAGDAFMLGDR